MSDLNTDIQTHKSGIRARYEKFVQGTINVDDFKLTQKEGEVLQLELNEGNSQIEMLTKTYEQYKLFFDVCQKNESMEKLVNTYLKEVVVHEDKRIDVSFHIQ